MRENASQVTGKTATIITENMALFANYLLHFAILVHIKLAIMQKPTTGNDNNNPMEFNIGGVLSNKESEDHFHYIIQVSFELLSKMKDGLLIWDCM